MTRSTLCIWLCVFALTAARAFGLGVTEAQVSHDDFADLGKVTLISPAGPAQGLLLVLDTDENVPAHLYTLARSGYVSAHIPLHHFLSSVRGADGDCINLVTLLDVFSQHLQEKFRFAHYQRPILLGLGDAAAVALATTAQAPNHLLQAGAGIGSPADVALTAPPCAAPALSVQIRPGRSGEAARYHIAATNTATPWHTLANLQQLDAFLAGLGVNAGAAGNGLRDLALVELPAPAAPIDPTLRDTFVILLSGDGGWANIDKDIGEALNAHGLPVVGWNSLQYFWQEKSPQQAGADLARTIVHYQQTWRRPRVLLIGFSLGADVLPFMINRLPAAQRAAIVDTVFLGLAAQVDFQFHVANWLGGNSSTARPLAPELAKLQGLPMLCIYGTDDDETICSSKPAGMETIALPGDHHFDGDYPRATQLILDHLHRRTAP